MARRVLEDLEGDGEKNGTDHHTYSKDDVFGEMDGCVGDIGPGERFNIWRTLANCDIVGPHDAS